MNWWADGLLQRGGPPALLSWVIWVIGSIVLHELAHGWAAIRQGDDTPIESGHMTWNPIVHMGGGGLLAFALIGVAWGSMPVDPRRFRHRYSDALVSAAGPLTNLALACVATVLGVIWIAVHPPVSEALYRNTYYFFVDGAVLNLVLLFLNLIPVPPLDGSKVLGNLVPPYGRLVASPTFAPLGLLVLIAIFVRGGGAIFGTAERIVAAVYRAIF